MPMPCAACGYAAIVCRTIVRARANTQRVYATNASGSIQHLTTSSRKSRGQQRRLGGACMGPQVLIILHTYAYAYAFRISAFRPHPCAIWTRVVMSNEL
eukprot:scaffold17394_cov114-Isochrysis_galbana.AAC.5